MTEADVEVRIRQAIELVLPALAAGRITHQKTFSVRLGHKAIRINGTKTDIIRGRLDILIELDGKPLAVLEIKKPGEPLDERVTKQGLSYARTLDNDTLPPLVITTNGQDSNFFRTWDGSRWEAQTRDEHALQSLFTQAAEASGEDIDKAVQHLLETVPSAWLQAIRNFTAKEIENLTGDLLDISKPVAKGFNIPRKAMIHVGELLLRGVKKIAIQGDPFSGKTNLLVNLCSQKHYNDFCYLYVDLAGSSEGIFDRIASIFTSEFFRTIGTAQVKTWIAHQLSRPNTTPLVVLIDGLDSSALISFRPDLDTLARHAEQGRLALVFSGHEDVVRALSVVGGTNQRTITGRNLEPVRLGILDTDEWKAATQILLTNFKAGFEVCAPMVYELRLPRLLRLLASTVSTKETAADGMVARLWSVCGPHWFGRFWDDFSTKEVRDGFRRMAEGLLAEIETSREPTAALRSRMTGALSVEIVESIIAHEHRRWLLDHGFLQFIFQPNGARYYLPKIPELLVAATAQIISEQTIAKFGDEGASAAASLLMSKTQELPYNGITCALALIFVSHTRGDIVSAIVPFLLRSPPDTIAIKPGAKLAVLRADGTAADLDFTSLTEEVIGTATMSSNMHPWLALSYLMVHHDDVSQRLETIREIGSSATPITGLEQSPQLMRPFEESSFPGGIHLLHGASALLEPITPVIYIALKEHPAEMAALAKEAIAAKNIPLIHRLFHGACGVSGIADHSVNDFVMGLANELRIALDSFVGDLVNKTE
jgi:hypothetical protein